MKLLSAGLMAQLVFGACMSGSLEDQVKYSDIIVLAKVQKVEEFKSTAKAASKSKPIKVTLEVVERWKGENKKTLEIFDRSHQQYATSLETGKTYLLFLSFYPARYWLEGIESSARQARVLPKKHSKIYRVIPCSKSEEISLAQSTITELIKLK